MKRLGDNMLYHKERTDELMKEYDKYIDSAPVIRMPEVYGHLANVGSRRFWITRKRAVEVVKALDSGIDILKRMRPTKREMYLEVYRRVNILREERPEDSLDKLCGIVIRQQAPKFYLTSGSIKITICKAKKEWEERKRQKLQHLSHPQS